MTDELFVSDELRRAKEQEWKRDHFNRIREYYEWRTPEIMAVDPWRWGVEPYEIDWTSIFSPIEDAFWQDIRSEGAVLYPQYPACGFFLDFAHPKVKVAVECDGKQWHMDRKKDWARDDILRKHGWTVYRLTGRQCFEDTKQKLDDDGCDRLEFGRPRLLLQALGREFKIIGRFAR